MRKLFATETSNWLKDLILCNNNHLEGNIIAVFDYSVILQLDGCFLIHMTAHPENLSPFSLYIKGLKAKNFTINQRLILKRGWIIFENLLIEIKDQINTYNESAKILSSPQCFNDKDIKCSNLYKPRFVELRNEIIIATLSEDRENLVLWLSKLIGLGDGLTPFGDDYLLGFIYCQYVSEKYELIEAIKALTLEKLGQLTSMISEEFLYHALNGRFSKNIVENNWDQLLNYGYNSGYFTLMGITDALNIKLRPALN